jgi:hypothetical protein
MAVHWSGAVRTIERSFRRLANICSLYSQLPEPESTVNRLCAGLMSMAAIYWDQELYSVVERIFRQSAEFCSEHEVWKLNVAHTFFMQARCAVLCCAVLCCIPSLRVVGYAALHTPSMQAPVLIISALCSGLLHWLCS